MAGAVKSRPYAGPAARARAGRRVLEDALDSAGWPWAVAISRLIDLWITIEDLKEAA